MYFKLGIIFPKQIPVSVNQLPAYPIKLQYLYVKVNKVSICVCPTDTLYGPHWKREAKQENLVETYTNI